MNLIFIAIIYMLCTITFGTNYLFLVITLMSVFAFFRFEKKYFYLLILLNLCLLTHQYKINRVINFKYEGEVVEIKNNSVKIRYQDYYAYLYDANEVNYGDYISFSGEVSKITSLNNFNIFNFENYAYLNNIRFNVKVNDLKVIRRSNSLKTQIYNYVKNMKNTEFKTLCLSTFYKTSDENNPDYINALFNSGMHLNIFFKSLERFISIFIDYNLVNKLSFGFPIIYALFFPTSISVIRIFIMKILRLSKLVYRDKVAILIMLLLLINPANIFNIGFSLPIMLSLGNVFYKFNIPRFIYNRLVVFPLTLNINFTYGLYHILLFGIYRYLYFGLFLLTLLAFGLNGLQFIPLFYQSFLINLLKSLAFIMKFSIYGKMDLIYILIFYYLLFTIIKKHELIKLLAISLLNFGLLLYYPFHQVTMVDVGQGDCFLIKLSFNRGLIMIDTGGNKFKDLGNDVLIPYLHSIGYSKLDYVVLSHNDFDHVGAYESLNKYIKIDKLITNKELTKEFKQSGYPFYILNNEITADNENDNSLMMYFKLDNRTFLMMGDASKEKELDLIKNYDLLRVDVLKLSHHGSKTSSDKRFLNIVNPSLALISAGINNSYGHPNKEVLEILEDEEIPYVNSAKNGAVKLTIVFNNILIRKMKK